MPKTYRPTEAIRVFESFGWRVSRQRGSHVNMNKLDNPNVLSIPMSRRELGRGLLRAAIRKSGISLQQFEDRANEIL